MYLLLPVLENVKAGHTCAKCYRSIAEGDLCVVYFGTEIGKKIDDEVYHEFCADSIPAQMSLAGIAEAIEFYVSYQHENMRRNG